MLNLNERDNRRAQDRTDRSETLVQAQSDGAIPSWQLLDEQHTLLERVVDFAFDTLGARRPHPRVYDVTVHPWGE